MKRIFELDRVNQFNLKDVPKGYIDLLEKWKGCEVLSESEEYVRHMREYDEHTKDYKYIVVDVFGRIWYNEVKYHRGYYNKNGEACFTGREDDKLIFVVNTTQLTYERYLKDIALHYRINGKHRKMAVLKKKYPEVDFRIL